MSLDDFIQLLSQTSQNINQVKQPEILETKEQPVTQLNEVKQSESHTMEEPTVNSELQPTENKEPVITESVENTKEEPKTNTETSNQFNGKIIITEIEQFVKHANNVLETIEVFLIPIEQIFIYAFETKNTIFVEEKKVITSFDNLVNEVKTAGAKGNFVFTLKQVTEEFVKLLRKIFHL